MLSGETKSHQHSP